MLWYVGQIGIVLEIVGALIIVFTAYKTKKEFSDINNPASFAESGDALEKLVSAVRSQFKNEMFGFSFFAIGLLMQFVGGFDA